MGESGTHRNGKDKKAYDFLRTGHLAEAEHLCRMSLAADPDNGSARHILALVFAAGADYEAAEEQTAGAIRIDPENPLYHCTMGDVCRSLGRSADAMDFYERATSFDPGLVPAWINLGITCHELGLFERALGSFDRAVGIDPGSGIPWACRGNVLLELGRFREGTSSFIRGAILSPGLMEAYGSLSRALMASDDMKEGFAGCLETFGAESNGIEILSNFGAVLQEEGRLEEAIECFTRIVTQDPSRADGFNNLGLAQKRTGRYEEASKSFEQAIALRPDFVEAYNNLGVACYGRGLFEEARSHFETTVGLRETYATGYTNLGMILAEEGRTEAARACYEKADAIAPDPGLKVALATLVPVICRSLEEIDATPVRLRENLAALLDRGVAIEDPIRQIGRANFYLPYQGGDRSLQEKLAEFYGHICPGLRYTASHCREERRRPVGKKIKIAIVSRHLKEHTIGNYMKGIIAHLDRSAFEIHTVLFPNPRDETIEFIEAHSDRTTVAPESLRELRRLIAEIEADILLYPDIGMEPYTYFLAMSRLAPVQCVFYGHPITTGIGSVDYFISHEDCETPDSAAHYTERLVALPARVAYTYYYKPRIKGPPAKKADFSLPDSAHLYLCSQSLFKVHPYFDGILAAVLSRDPEALILFFHGKHASWADLLKARLEKTLRIMSERVRFLPRYEYDDYLRLVALADAALDTTHFNGGATTFDAFAVGTPVVTLPGEYMRGRQTYALYKRMGLLECVAGTPDEYADIALRLGKDPLFRGEIKEKILARNNLIFEDENMVRELEVLFKGMFAKRGI